MANCEKFAENSKNIENENGLKNVLINFQFHKS